MVGLLGAITKGCRPTGFRQQECIVSWFWRKEVQGHGASRSDLGGDLSPGVACGCLFAVTSHGLSSECAERERAKSSSKDISSLQSLSRVPLFATLWTAAHQVSLSFLCLRTYQIRSPPWDFFGRANAEAETPVLWPPHAKS